MSTSSSVARISSPRATRSSHAVSLTAATAVVADPTSAAPRLAQPADEVLEHGCRATAGVRGCCLLGQLAGGAGPQHGTRRADLVSRDHHVCAGTANARADLARQRTHVAACLPEGGGGDDRDIHRSAVGCSDRALQAALF